MGSEQEQDRVLCPCCATKCPDCVGFHKDIQLAAPGVVRHTEPGTDALEIHRSEYSTNSEDADINSSDLIMAMDPKDISCPRCRKILNHAQKQMRNAPTISRNKVISICDHCRLSHYKTISCSKCEKLVQKFTNKLNKYKEEELQKREPMHTLKTRPMKSWKANDQTASIESEIILKERTCITQVDRQGLIFDGVDAIQHMQRNESVETNREIRFGDNIQYNQQTSSQIFAVVNREDKDPLFPINLIRSGSTKSLPEKKTMFGIHKHILKDMLKKNYITDTIKQSLRNRISSIDYGFISDDEVYLRNDTYETKQTDKKETVRIKASKPILLVTPTNSLNSRSSNEYLQQIYNVSDDTNIIRTTSDYIERPTSKPPYLHDLGISQSKQQQSSQKYLGKSKQWLKNNNECQKIRSIKKDHSQERIPFFYISDNNNASSIEKQFSFKFIRENQLKKHPMELATSSELMKNTLEMLNKRKNARLQKSISMSLKKQENKAGTLKLVEESVKTPKEKKFEPIAKPKLSDIKMKEVESKSIEKTLEQPIISISIKEKYEDQKEKVVKRNLRNNYDKQNVSITQTKKYDLKGQIKKEEVAREREAQPKTENLKQSKPDKEKHKTQRKDRELKRTKEETLQFGKEKEAFNVLKEEKILYNKQKESNQNEKYVQVYEENHESKQPLKAKDDIVSTNTDKIEKGDLIQQNKEISRKMPEKVKADLPNLESKKGLEHRKNNDTYVPETVKKELKPNVGKDLQKPEQVKQKLQIMQIKEPELKAEPHLSRRREEISAKNLLDIKQIKVRNASSDDLMLNLVKLRTKPVKTTEKKKPTAMKDLDLTIAQADRQFIEKSGSPIYVDSVAELESESIISLPEEKGMGDIIIGNEVMKYNPSLQKERIKSEVFPLIFYSNFDNEETSPGSKPITSVPWQNVPPKQGQDVEASKGIIHYALSDRSFIEKGWTMLPTEKVVRKMNVYRMRPAHPEFDWFAHNKNKKIMTYDSGDKFAEFDDNGRGRWYYRNGSLALDYYDAEELNAQQRYVVYSSGDPDERGKTHPFTVLAMFDYLGNGVVFDHSGKIRLKYNQTEGVVLDRSLGPVSHWIWHTLNDPPVLQQVMIDTQMSQKDPNIVKMFTKADDKTRPDNEEMLAIEFDNFIKEKSKKLTQTFKPFQIKMKALKINDYFSLKVLDQANIYLIFRDGSVNIKLNIGMILDHKEIVDTDTAEVGEVSNSLERLPARTDSLAGLQKSIKYAERYERMRLNREQRLRPMLPVSSADQLTAASSKPLRPRFRTISSGSTVSETEYCKCRKPSSNVYYNSRL